MRRVPWSAGLLLACSLATGAATHSSEAHSSGAPSSALDFFVSAQVDVDASGKSHVVEMGKVSRLSDVPSLVPIANVIAQRLRERIESWQFVPATRDGQAVASTTGLHVALEGSDDGHGGLAVRILGASTGGDLRDANVLALAIAVTRAQEEARITLDVEYDETGHVTSLSEVDSKRFHRGRWVPAGPTLRKEVLDAAHHWVFVPEKIEGHPIAGGGRVPIVLCLDAVCATAPDTPDKQTSGVSFAAVDPAVKLRSAVAGTAL